MKINLEGKKALVGASTQGLGKAIALQLASCGAAITLMARNEEKLKATLRDLDTSFNQKHGYIVVDFYDFNDFEAKTSAYFKHKNIDILINNTNGPEAGGVFEKNINDYQKAFDLLFKTTCHLTLLAVENMKRNRYGRIINTASLTVKEPLSNLVLSNTIRAAVAIWAKTLAKDVAPFGITVNTILTGLFDTERIQQLNKIQANTKGLSLEENLKLMTQEIPAGRLGKPDEFGYLVTFLASNYASYITGTNISIDGGLIKSL
ncbi:MAG TPA: SDR family oxidoreductase [Lutibacter sp.]